MKKINVDLFIEYDEEKETIEYYNIGGEHTLGEIAVIVAAFKRCLEDWGYEVKRKEEDEND